MSEFTAPPLTPTGPSGDAMDRRFLAIRESGWGTPFTLVQPRNLCFWVFVWGMVAGTVHMVGFLVPAGQYGVALGSGVLLFGVYTVPWLLLLHYHNRYTSIPARPLVLAFVWSFVAGTFWMGIQGNPAILSLYSKAFGPAFGQSWSAGLTAPITEEIIKATALVLVVGLAPRLVNSAYDGLVIGAYSGLGLQIAEDILYVVNSAAGAHGTDQVGTAVGILTNRGYVGLFQHVLFSAVYCAGLVWLLGRGSRHRLRGALLVLAVTLLHSAWDNSAALGFLLAGPLGPLLLLWVLLPVLGLLLLWLTFRLAAPREQAWMRDLLRPEVERGVITEEELVAVSGGYRARRRYLRHAEHRRAEKHVLHAIADFASELARGGGRETARVEHARAEILRLRAA
ncbi:PrsW family intramembrane metalloprotease [Pseudonocardia pini]|uniref:PrsW family intramembrane metalloprotease n=1 Tax=Pseudonocardia pini TaxID=2758030 RepID=UPI0015F06D4D|nr:PrsW family glutamic-type intramembrane protease [Pseudonocardia pini]